MFANSSLNRFPLRARTWTKWGTNLTAVLTIALLSLFFPFAPANCNAEATARAAKRPPLVRVQSNLELASKARLDLHHPVELVNKDFYELALSVGMFENKNALALSLPAKFQLLCYNKDSVGPTIRVRRGTTFHIRLKNTLPAPNAGVPHQIAGTSEQPHDLCTTNLHTHGLHVSPAGNGDNVFIDVKPQNEVTFEYSVPADHPSGTFWYHPHHHGSVAYQLSNGLAGADRRGSTTRRYRGPRGHPGDSGSEGTDSVVSAL